MREQHRLAASIHPIQVEHTIIQDEAIAQRRTVQTKGLLPPGIDIPRLPTRFDHQLDVARIGILRAPLSHNEQPTQRRDEAVVNLRVGTTLVKVRILPPTLDVPTLGRRQELHGRRHAADGGPFFSPIFIFIFRPPKPTPWRITAWASESATCQTPTHLRHRLLQQVIHQLGDGIVISQAKDLTGQPMNDFDSVVLSSVSQDLPLLQDLNQSCTY